MLFQDNPSTAVTLTMRAPVGAIWEACTDPALPVENSPELIESSWDPEGPPPGVGARLRGTNRMGEKQWTTTSEVVMWDPLRSWSYEVSNGTETSSQWWFELDDHNDGTVTVTQRVRLGPGRSGLTAAIERSPDHEADIIAGRLQFIADAMKANLQAIEARAAF